MVVHQVTLDGLVHMLLLVESAAVQLGLMEVSLVLDVAEERLLNLCDGFDLVTCVLEIEVIAAVAESAVVAVDELVSYNAEPTPNLHLEGCLHPFQRRPLESYMAEYHHSTRSSTYPVLFYAALSEVPLVLSFPLLVSVCPPPLWHEANPAYYLQHLAIAVGVQAAAPWTGRVVVDLQVLAVVEAVVMSWLLEVATLDEVVTSLDAMRYFAPMAEESD